MDSYTKLLLHCNGTDGSQVFTDVTGKTVTALGNAQIDTGKSRFGGASALFDGDGDALQITTHTDLDFGSGDFTVDWWEYRTSSTASKASISKRSVGLMLCFSEDGYLRSFASSDGVDWDIFANKSHGAISLNEWVHLAISRSGNNFYFFKNGTVTDTATSSASIATAGYDLYIAKRDTNYFTGWMDEIRISKGIARWTSNFTPPTREYGAYGGFSGVSNPWIFFKEACDRNKKLWIPKGLILPQDLGFSY